jgi:hypothetical protein
MALDLGTGAEETRRRIAEAIALQEAQRSQARARLAMQGEIANGDSSGLGGAAVDEAARIAQMRPQSQAPSLDTWYSALAGDENRRVAGLTAAGELALAEQQKGLDYERTMDNRHDQMRDLAAYAKVLAEARDAAPTGGGGGGGGGRRSGGGGKPAPVAYVPPARSDPYAAILGTLRSQLRPTPIPTRRSSVPRPTATTRRPVRPSRTATRYS